MIKRMNIFGEAVSIGLAVAIALVLTGCPSCQLSHHGTVPGFCGDAVGAGISFERAVVDNFQHVGTFQAKALKPAVRNEAAQADPSAHPGNGNFGEFGRLADRDVFGGRFVHIGNRTGICA